MRSQFFFLFKLFVISAIAAFGIKFFGTYGLTFTAADMNAIAFAALTLPLSMFPLIFWWNR